MPSTQGTSRVFFVFFFLPLLGACSPVMLKLSKYFSFLSWDYPLRQGSIFSLSLTLSASDHAWSSCGCWSTRCCSLPGLLLVLLGNPQATWTKKGLCVQSKVLTELCSSSESPAGLVCPSTLSRCAVSHHASTICLKRGTPLMGRKSKQEE